MRDVLQLAVVAPFADGAVEGFGVESERVGNLRVFLAVELGGEPVPELLLLNGALRSFGFLLRGGIGREREEHPDVVPEDDGDDGLGRAVVGVEAGDVALEVSVFGEPEDREAHCDAEHHDSEPADGCDEVFSAVGKAFFLPAGEGGVEVLALLSGEAEEEVSAFAVENLEEVVVVGSELLEAFIECAFGRGVGEDVVPDCRNVQAVECEAAEEAVFRVGDEVENLARSAGEDGGEAGLADVDIFAVLAADVGDGLVVEGLAEAVGVVAVVGAEGVGEGVALGLEHQSAASVVVQHLVDCCGGGVGRNEEHTEGRFLGLLHRGFLFAGGVVFGELLLVFHNFGLVDFAEAVVDWFDKVAAEGEAAFAGGGSGGDEEEEVREDGTAVVDAFYVGHTGGEDCERTEDEDVFVIDGVAHGSDSAEEFGQVVPDVLRECREGFAGGDFRSFRRILNIRSGGVCGFHL